MRPFHNKVITVTNNQINSTIKLTTLGKLVKIKSLTVMDGQNKIYLKYSVEIKVQNPNKIHKIMPHEISTGINICKQLS